MYFLFSGVTVLLVYNVEVLHVFGVSSNILIFFPQKRFKNCVPVLVVILKRQNNVHVDSSDCFLFVNCVSPSECSN